MRILFIDNDVTRHEGHQKMINKFKGHEISLREYCTKDELMTFKKSSTYHFYIVHRNNRREYRYIFSEKLGEERIFFSGDEDHPAKTEFGIYSSIETLEEDLNKLLDNA